MPTSVQTAAAARPLLKWAGGKRQLLPRLRDYYPADFTRYIEPFVGSGAVFFDLHASGRLDGRRVLLADVNADIIGCYRMVREDPESVIAALAALETEHRQRGTSCYYDVRDRRFNPARAAFLGTLLSDRSSAATHYTPAMAAMLIYLNRTGYNGLFRLNRRGEFNVPAGRYSNPRICDAQHIRTVASALSGRQIRLECMPFEETLREAGRGDFIYCDPPYAPLSRTSSFANYTADGFTAIDQHRLQQGIVRIASCGAMVVLSNSSAPEILTAYATPRARLARLRVHRVPARRAINSLGASRGPVEELLITNVGRSPIGARVMAGMLLRARDPDKLQTARAGKRQT